MHSTCKPLHLQRFERVGRFESFRTFRNVASGWKASSGSGGDPKLSERTVRDKPDTPISPTQTLCSRANPAKNWPAKPNCCFWNLLACCFTPSAFALKGLQSTLRQALLKGGGNSEGSLILRHTRLRAHLKMGERKKGLCFNYPKVPHKM